MGRLYAVACICDVMMMAVPLQTLFVLQTCSLSPVVFTDLSRDLALHEKWRGAKGDGKS